jgi:hypothetical protein
MTSVRASVQSDSMTAISMSWAFLAIFIVIGVLNLILVHPVPGVFYIVLCAIYMPQTNLFLRKKLGFAIPLVVKVILGLMVLWATLAVGDLAEMAGL